MSQSLDLNADLGEGVGDDEAMLGIVSSAGRGIVAGRPWWMETIASTSSSAVIPLWR